MVAIAWATQLASTHDLVKSATHLKNEYIRIPDLRMSCSHLTRLGMGRHQDNSMQQRRQTTCLTDWLIHQHWTCWVCVGCIIEGMCEMRTCGGSEDLWVKNYNRILKYWTRARLGRVAPLGRPRSVYKSNVECSFLSRNDGQTTLKVKVNDPISNTTWENPKMHIWCKCGDSCSNPLPVIMQRSQICQNSKSKWPKWP